MYFTFINKKENSMIFPIDRKEEICTFISLDRIYHISYFPIDRKEEIWYILSREMKVLRHWKIT